MSDPSTPTTVYVSNKAKALKVVRKLHNCGMLVGYNAKEKCLYGFRPKFYDEDQFWTRIRDEYRNA